MSSATAKAGATQFKKNRAGDFVCPECGNTYGLARAVRRHLTEMHNWPQSKSTERRKKREGAQAQVVEQEAPPVVETVNEDTVSFQVRSELRELALPLQEKLSTIEKRLVILNREAQDLRDARAQIERMLKGLMGPQQPVKANVNAGGEAVYRKKVAAVQGYLKVLPEDLQEGFTAHGLSDAMRNDGITPAVGGPTAARIIQELHDQGVVRLDRISQGGGKSYVLASRNGNREE